MSQPSRRIICTLTDDQRVSQILEWSSLGNMAQSRAELPNGVASTYALELADQIEELAAREISCCGSWLTIEHERGSELFHLRVTAASPEGVAQIKAFIAAPAHD